MPCTFELVAKRSMTLRTGAGPNWASTMRSHPWPYRLGVSTSATRLVANAMVANTAVTAAVTARRVVRVGIAS